MGNGAASGTEPLTPSTTNNPSQAETPPQTPKIDRSTLPDFDGSPKQNRWAEDLRTKALDDFEAADVSGYVASSVAPIRSKPSPNDTAEQTERRNLNALIRAEIDKRGEAEVLAEIEAAAREIAADMFANPSARDWIDSRYDASVLHRATTEALRRVATTGSAAKPKPAFELPPLDLPELVLPRLEGTPRQISWAEDLRRDLTEERAAETARDHLQAWRRWSSRRDAKNIRDALPELEKAIAEVGGDEAAAEILGREIYLKGREYAEKWSDSRDWIDLKTEQNSTLTPYDALKVAGTPQDAAAILRRYAADAKKCDTQTPKGTPRILGRTANGENPVETLRRIKAAAIDSRRVELDGVLPPANDKAENREKMQRRYRIGSGALQIGRGSKAPTITRDLEEKIVEGLDFFGRVLDNLGDRKPNAKFWETSFYQNCFGNGVFDAKDNKIRLRGWGLDKLHANVAHEYAHALERHAPELRKRLYGLYVKLTTEDGGKRTPVIEALNKDKKVVYYYRPLAAKFSKMNVPQYALRTYEGGEKYPPTELFSTWCEKLCEDPEIFVADYEEFFKEVFGVLYEWKAM